MADHESAEPAESPQECYGISAETIKDIDQALDGEHTGELIEGVLDPLHSADVADYLDQATHDHRRAFVEATQEHFDSEILITLRDGVREEIVELLGPKYSAQALSELETDDAVGVIEDLAPEEQSEILKAIPLEYRKNLEQGLAYPEDSAGRLVSPQMVVIPEFWTVGHVIDYLREAEDLPKDFYQLLVVDPKMHPLGGVLLSRVMRSNRSVPIKEIMETELRLIKAETDQEEVAYLFRQYGLVSAPVVSADRRLIGVITVDDVVNVVQEEAEEDILRLGGISDTDVHRDLLETVRLRFPWLVINLLTAIVASAVIAAFEGTIERLAALAVLMPIIASMGGNAGIQTVTVAVRAIATKELTRSNMYRVMGKELMVGAINGSAFALLTAIVVFLWYDNLILSIVFAAAMIVTLLLAGISGALIPLGLTRIGVDPAVASSVFLTTITDVVAFAAFLGLAALILL